MHQQAMQLAWTIFRATDTFPAFADALRQAWLTVKARAALKARPTLLTFRKASGEVTRRTATAYTGPVKGTGTSSSLTVVFHSLTDQSTRSFRVDRLVGFSAID